METFQCRLFAFALASVLFCWHSRCALAQNQQGEESNVIPPITEQASNVTFSGSGAVNLAPFVAPGAMPQATPSPECENHRHARIMFRVSCTSDPKQKSTDSCTGSISVFELGITQNVSGQVSGVPGGSYTMTLHSPDMSVSSCSLSNSGASEDAGNTIVMQSCSVSAMGCRWTATGAGGNQVVTTSAAVSVRPIL